MIPTVIECGFIQNHKAGGHIEYVPYIDVRRNAYLCDIKLWFTVVERKVLQKNGKGDWEKPSSYKFTNKTEWFSGVGFTDKQLARTMLLECKYAWELKVMKAHDDVTVKTTIEKLWP